MRHEQRFPGDASPRLNAPTRFWDASAPGGQQTQKERRMREAAERARRTDCAGTENKGGYATHRDLPPSIVARRKSCSALFGITLSVTAAWPRKRSCDLHRVRRRLHEHDEGFVLVSTGCGRRHCALHDDEDTTCFIASAGFCRNLLKFDDNATRTLDAADLRRPLDEHKDWRTPCRITRAVIPMVLFDSP
ncbi:hypothetical protein HPB51_025784 [Rhipicephalus microplus]|uniref:Uncharacterized protein n=1 Tax=Rhipicephalus microplus TaxID=6941 RepID=A0A9J6EJN1_RHIMP|nr:hypothetical protein HPB51_025784 [Rhipicephalus microplus]